MMVVLGEGDAASGDKEVLAFREHFYAYNETPHRTCVVNCSGRG